MNIIQTFGPDYPIVKISAPKIVINNVKDLCMLNTSHSIILTIQCILNLYSTKTLQSGEIFFNDIFCFNNDEVFVVIDAFEYSSTHNNSHNRNTTIFSEVRHSEIKSDSTTKMVNIFHKIELKFN